MPRPPFGLTRSPRDGNLAFASPGRLPGSPQHGSRPSDTTCGHSTAIENGVGGTMRIEYTVHARLRMTTRGVTEAEVVTTIESPDAVWPGEVGPEEIAVRHSVDRDIRVVYRELGADHVPIITVMKPRSHRGEQDS